MSPYVYIDTKLVLGNPIAIKVRYSIYLLSVDQSGANCLILVFTLTFIFPFACLQKQAFFSNSKSFVEQQQYIFDTLWEKAIPARIKIRQIELANEQEFTRSISSKEVGDILMDLIECSVKSILIFLPGYEVVTWIYEQRVFEGLHNATLRGVEVRIIMDQAAGKDYFEEWFKRFSIQFLLTSMPNTDLDIIVDYKFTLSIDPDLSTNDNKVGTYSNIEARAMVSSSIFENYWIKSTCLK